MQKLTLVRLIVRCSSCGEGTVEYDGQKDGIFNYSNRTLATYELCFEYADFMIHNKLPFAAHYNLMKDRYKRAGAERLLIARTTHRLLMLAFLRKLDVDYFMAFQCPICKHLPHEELVFVADGKELGHLKSLAVPYTPPVDTAAPKQGPAMAVDEYAPIKGAQVRRLLLKWAQGCDAKKQPFTHADAIVLQSAANASQQPEVWSLIDHIHQEGKWLDQDGRIEMRPQCPQEYRQLVRALAITHPASSLINPEYARSSSWRAVQTGGDLSSCWQQGKDLMRGFPLLQQLVAKKGWTVIPAGVRGVLALVTEAALRPTYKEPPPTLPVAGGGSGEDTHVFMPGYPLVRLLPPYKGRDTERDTDACRKYENASTRFSAGVMLVFCAHGVCVGLKMMEKCEGPSMLAEHVLHAAFGGSAHARVR